MVVFPSGFGPFFGKQFRHKAAVRGADDERRAEMFRKPQCRGEPTGTHDPIDACLTRKADVGERSVFAHGPVGEHFPAGSFRKSVKRFGGTFHGKIQRGDAENVEGAGEAFGSGRHKAFREFNKRFADAGDVVVRAVRVHAETHDACGGFNFAGDPVVVAAHHHRNRCAGKCNEFGVKFRCGGFNVVNKSSLVA